MNDDTVTWVVVGVAALLLLALLVWFLMRRRAQKQQQEHLRGRFGDEYDRRVEETGDERAAREHLAEVEQRREQARIRDLAPAARERYLQRWQAVQADFVDRPGESVDAADALVVDVMRERGYPVDDMETRADMVAADHPDVVRDYRAALDARQRHHAAGDEATTEELRRAMVHYRSLVERLVGEADDDHHVHGAAADGDAGDAPRGRHQADTPVAEAQRDDAQRPVAPVDDGRSEDGLSEDGRSEDGRSGEWRSDRDPHPVDLSGSDQPARQRAGHRADDR